MNICFAGGFGHFSHAADTKENISAVLVSDEDTAEYREFCKGKKTYRGYEEMIDREKPDAVVVDGVFDTHFKEAHYALSRGVHVFCEKPVCLRLSEISTLREAAEKSGALLYGMFTTRFEPPFYTLKKRADEGLIGKILLVNSQKTYILGKREPFYFEKERFGSTFAWVGIHGVEQALYVTGEKLGRHAYFARESASAAIDDRAVAVAEFGDVLATFTVDYLRPEGCGSHGDDRLRVTGERGVLEVVGGKLLYTAKGADGVPLALETPKEKIFDDFLSAARGEKEPVCTTEDTLAATEAVLRISSFEAAKS